MATDTTTTDTWTGAAGDGSWNNANNWSNGVPTSDSDVVIDTDTTQSITISSAVEISSLTISGTANIELTNAATDGSRIGVTVDNAISLDNSSGLLQVNHIVLSAYGDITGGTIAIDNATVQAAADFTSIVSFWPTADNKNPNFLYLQGSETTIPQVINFSSYDAITYNGRGTDTSGKDAISVSWVSILTSWSTQTTHPMC